MIRKIMNFMLDLRDRQRISICLSKGAAMINNRKINLTDPTTWEFSGFSQNGEDGIIDVLRKNLLKRNKYFIEIGSADGIDNNTAWLLVAEKYNGIMIEGNSTLSLRAQRIISNYSIGAECMNLFVNKDNIVNIKAKALVSDPDVFSLDIDGNDYYIAEKIFEIGFRPKIFVVEYNSVFGPEQSKTIIYDSDFVFSKYNSTQLYYGVSIAGWRKFFSDLGYKFVTVDQNGVNAFFADEAMFDKQFLANLAPLEFAENQYQYKKFGKSSIEQFKMIADQKYYTIK